MTLEGLAATRVESNTECFHCGSKLANFPDSKYVVLCDEKEVIVIQNPRVAKAAPMVFCCSDCMVYDSYLRYQDRVAKGIFRKQFALKYNDKIPTNFKTEDQDAIIK